MMVVFCNFVIILMCFNLQDKAGETMVAINGEQVAAATAGQSI